MYHTKLVGHDNKAASGTAQHAKQVDRVERFRHHDCRRCGSNGFDVAALFQRHQHLFRTHHTDHFVQLTATYREQAVR
ncbi:hypothetical protein D3C75_1338150 [compost metagenome]